MGSFSFGWFTKVRSVTCMCGSVGAADWIVAREQRQHSDSSSRCYSTLLFVQSGRRIENCFHRYWSTVRMDTSHNFQASLSRSTWVVDTVAPIERIHRRQITAAALVEQYQWRFLLVYQHLRSRIHVQWSWRDGHNSVFWEILCCELLGCLRCTWYCRARRRLRGEKWTD